MTSTGISWPSAAIAVASNGSRDSGVKPSTRSRVSGAANSSSEWPITASGG